MIGRTLVALVLGTFAILQAGGVQALADPLKGLRSVHERLIENPGDLDRLYEYAQEAIRQGNYESAVAVLEGMLVISRNQPRVLLELGALYHRMGAPRVARAYLEQGRRLAAEDSETTAVAEEYLQEALKLTSPAHWAGFIEFGLRYQSNPTLSPESSEILSGGFRVPLPPAREENSDTNALLRSRVEHRYSLDNRFSVDSDAILYATLYDDQDQLDYSALELVSGIRYRSPLNARGRYAIRPHIVLRGSLRDGDTFETTKGAGIDFHLVPWTDSRFTANYQYRDVDYEDFNGRGTAALRGGGEHRLDFGLISEIARGHLLAIRLFGRRHDAERAYFEFDQYDVAVRYSARIPNFLFEHRPQMTLAPYVIRRSTEYAAADPDIDPATGRNDKEWRFGLDFVVPFTPTWSAVLNLEHTRVDSNIVNYDSRNELFMLSIRKQF